MERGVEWQRRTGRFIASHVRYPIYGEKKTAGEFGSEAGGSLTRGCKFISKCFSAEQTGL